jgi:hypothetical protein
MDGQQQGHGPEDEAEGHQEDGAERAFEALRTEVAALRRGVELVYRQAQQPAPAGQAAPDYSLTLGRMEKALQAIATRLEGVERQPAMRLTPDSFRAEIDNLAHSAVSVVSRPFIEAVHETREAARVLEVLAGQVRERRDQQEWLAFAGAIGVMLGILLWFLLPGVLPRSAGDWMAASLIGGGRWEAGATLMDRADHGEFDRMWRLYKACPQESSTELCEATLAVKTQSREQEVGRRGSANDFYKAAR